jgi:predicted dehydrogenase/NADPH:quinone reductase-like Zn-dependent oxidoreductase
MRQVARRLRDGALELIEVPEPGPGPGFVSVRVAASVVSSGTERATLEVASKSLLAKAWARPDQARRVLERVRAEGRRDTIELVRQRLDELGPLGYSAAGRAIEAGAEVTGIAAGDRVAIGGGGFANHAEVDVVPQLLCARVPSGVSDEDAAFATLGAIALNGFRRAGADLGSTVAVIGLGLVGQLATRIALAAGCQVHGIDLDERLVELAAAAGARASLRSDAVSGREGSADAILICASSSNDDPIRLAAALARDRAPVVVVGDVRMDLPRGPFYGKELDLRLSRSYGPGRYDPDYELHGRDYPIGYVRWTERRNMEAFLGLVSSGRLAPSELVSHRFEIGEARRAYEVLRDERSVAILLSYPSAGTDRRGRETASSRPTAAGVSRGRLAGKLRFGLIGAGSFSTSRIIPGLIAAGCEPGVIASASGLSAESARRRFGFEVAVAGADAVLERDDLDLVVVATQHDSHASLAAAALERGRAVYVEKPLALDWSQLALVAEAWEASGPPLFVGFNRRHAPLAAELRKLGSPRLMSYRVNAGKLARDHWTNDLARGGGRLKGEGCHFVDFLCDQADADPVSVTARGFMSDPALALAATDNFNLQIDFDDGSSGTVIYAADAPTGPGKERFETSAPGAYAVIEDFKAGTIWGDGSKRTLRARRQDKGFAAQFEWIAGVLRGDAGPPPVESYLLSTLATLAGARSLETGRAEQIVQPEVPEPVLTDTLAEVGE